MPKPLFPLRKVVGEWYSQEHGGLFEQLECGHSQLVTGLQLATRRRCVPCGAKDPAHHPLTRAPRPDPASAESRWAKVVGEPSMKNPSACCRLRSANRASNPSGGRRLTTSSRSPRTSAAVLNTPTFGFASMGEMAPAFGLVADHLAEQTLADRGVCCSSDTTA